MTTLCLDLERIELEYKDGEQWKPLFEGTVIGRKRICTFDQVKAQVIRLTIAESRWFPQLSTFEVYNGK